MSVSLKLAPPGAALAGLRTLVRSRKVRPSSMPLLSRRGSQMDSVRSSRWKQMMNLQGSGVCVCVCVCADVSQNYINQAELAE